MLLVIIYFFLCNVSQSGYFYKILSWKLPQGFFTSDRLKQQEIWSLYSPSRSATGRCDQKVAERPIIGRKVADRLVKWPRPKRGCPKNGRDVINAYLHRPLFRTST